MIKDNMQGLPANILTKNLTSKGKAAGLNSAVGSSEVGLDVAIKSGDQNSKNSFVSLFTNMISPESGEATVGEKVVNNNPESKMDVLLKAKDADQNKKVNLKVATNEEALPAEVLNNVNKLLINTAVPAQKAVTDNVASTSVNLDQLLNSLKGTEGRVDETLLNKEEEDSQSIKGGDLKNTKSSSPLDFLIKESKGKDVGASVLNNSEPVTNDFTSKLGLSGEEFVNNKVDKSFAKTTNGSVLTEQNFDPKEMVQKQMNQSMKAYGQKQSILNDSIIKNTKDLAFKDKKSKSNTDELQTPDLKIGANLAMIKEPLIPVMQKSEAGNNLIDTNNSGKVLDLSKIQTSNTTEIIKRISDYVEQSQLANKESLDLTVKHDSLGQFKIQVNRPMGNGPSQVDMQITTSTPEGHDFFVRNEIGLMKNLTQAGIQLSDLRIVSHSSESMNFGGNDSRQFNQSQQQNSREFMSFDSGNHSQGSERRKALWEQAAEQRRGA